MSYNQQLFSALNILPLHTYAESVTISDKPKSTGEIVKWVTVDYNNNNKKWEITLYHYNEDKQKNDVKNRIVSSKNQVLNMVKKFIPVNQTISIHMTEDWQFSKKLKKQYPLDGVPGLYNLSSG